MTKRLDLDRVQSETVWFSQGITGSPSSTAIDHGTCTGLLDDDHPQYLLINGTRAMAAALNMGGFAITNVGNVDGVDVSAHAANSDIHVAHSGVTLAAGNGLTGGGTIAASRTFAVGAGDGIDVAADSVAVDVTDFIDTAYGLTEDTNNIRINLASSSGLEFLTGALKIDLQTNSGMALGISGVAVGTPSDVTISSANSVTGGSHAHAVISSSNPGAAAALLASSAAGALTLVNATVSADLSASRMVSSLIPKTTDTYDLGSSTLLWRKGYLSEMEAVLFAENTITLLGGWFYVPKYAGTAQEDIDGSETAIDLGVSDALLSVNDFIIFRASLAVEYMQLTSYAGANVWNVTRNVDGSGANTWPQGAPFAALGYTGDGRIEFNAYDTPRVSIIKQGSTYNSQTELIRLGDLNGMADYVSEEYGVFIGDYSGNKWLAYDETNSLRIRGDALIDGTVQATSFTTDIGALLFSRSDGSLLLGPGCEITPTSWTTLRGQAATLSGAFHQVAGCWPASRALMVEGATTNYCTNPSIETNTTGWTQANAPDTFERSASSSLFGEYSLHIAHSGDSTRGAYFGSIDVSPSQTYSASLYVRGSGTIQIWLDERDASDTRIGSVTSVLHTLSSDWKRVLVTKTFGATGVKLRLYTLTDTVNATDWYTDAVQIEASSFHTSYCDGSLGTGYSWSGTAHASTSARTATVANLDAHAGLVNQNDTFSFVTWVQAQYDYDAAWPQPSANYVSDMRNFATGNGYILYYDEATETWKFNRDGSTILESTAQTFSAGDWVLLGITANTAGVQMYVNGVLSDTYAAAISGLIVTDWAIGSSYTGSAGHGGFAFSEYAVFDRVLTAGEIAKIYVMGAPLADIGANLRPGVYLNDGEFRLTSSTAGLHTELSAPGMGIYNGTGPTGVGRVLVGMVNTTSKVLDLTATDLGMFGYDSSNNLQTAWYASGTNAGKITAGAGGVVLDSGGVKLISGTAYSGAKSLNMYDGTTLMGYVAGLTPGVTGSHWIDVHGSSVAGENTTVRCRADVPSGQQGLVSLNVNVTAGMTPYFILSNGASYEQIETNAVLSIFNSTAAPSASVTNGVLLYAQDVSTSSELRVRDEAGNVTTLSPHNFDGIPGGPSEPMAWAYHSERDGKYIAVDMLKLARLVEEKTGVKLVYTGEVK